LTGLSSDPFVRILVAPAVVHRLDVLSKATVLPRYPGLSVI